MSVYKHKDSPFYHFDFQHKGVRFHGSTGCTSRREAEAFERVERDRAKQFLKVASSSASTKLDDVAGRYWNEIGQHHAGADTTWRDIERLINYFGPTKLLTEIGDDDVARLVAWRRGHRVTRRGKGKKKPAPLIAPATVNRSTTEVLKKLFTRAKAWGIRFDHEPSWKQHWLKEPQEIIRELRGDEADRLERATRDDYQPVFELASASGLRLNECLLRWSEVNWDARKIEKAGKGDKRVSVPITDAIRQILWPLRGHHPEAVFTYVARRTKKTAGLVKGQRYPVTYNGLKTIWKRTRAAAGLSGFRFHDFRHDFATKLLRETKNLKLVQRALNHADIKTTTKYAHVVDDEVAAGIDAMQKSRKKSRTTARKVS
ncbi:bll5003 [Bradyrhizobium diazoefficiens USDA 110]|uniref:Bll5003 protein n=1 Tax=Bradyrhizobium diazoefficiens (strain JCM 10833 / BCRC 13528 / IAM 13628 / NBRC 14792 / USDA 110) TaxID=224911 RepID=Q89KA6_BRADU|nr:tyrosine-type recombinase/integrase [Bradyrhizobium diazoefficiens]AND90226.1 integrase [Bradyrhizobium diazoefficiens USDA 110]QBP23786.1 integrase [Bradyrhizobium diazoefficiens]BAC50268.1 bll5003 [Bradyrhizobium diazoefficiens USDA 110]BCF44909.1 integrase [Bradyrhizobium diazoefficiens]BCF71057.1 integrase [Bradyrhizobium diazoefficiens]